DPVETTFRQLHGYRVVVASFRVREPDAELAAAAATRRENRSVLVLAVDGSLETELDLTVREPTDGLDLPFRNLLLTAAVLGRHGRHAPGQRLRVLQMGLVADLGVVRGQIVRVGIVPGKTGGTGGRTASQ